MAIRYAVEQWVPPSFPGDDYHHWVPVTRNDATVRMIWPQHFPRDGMFLGAGDARSFMNSMLEKSGADSRTLRVVEVRYIESRRPL